MKNFKLLLAGAIMIAVGSSFAAQLDADPSGEYVLVNGIYVPVAGRTGECVDTGTFCSYNKIGNAPGESGEFQNPANFEGVDAGQHWQE